MNHPSEVGTPTFWGRPHLNGGGRSIPQKGGCHQVETGGIGGLGVATDIRYEKSRGSSTAMSELDLPLRAKSGPRRSLGALNC